MPARALLSGTGTRDYKVTLAQFVYKYISTIGVDYGVKGIVLSGEEVKVNFWDLAGSKEYLEVRNEFYKDSQGCLLVGGWLLSAPVLPPADHAFRYLTSRTKSLLITWSCG